MTGELFEDLRVAVGCTFISDIRVDENRQRTIRVASSFEHEHYSEKQWNDLADYLKCPRELFTGD